MNKMTEEDVKVKYITPALQNKDWDPKTQMRFEYYYTAGKINVRGNITQRSSGKKVDYLLYYKSNLPIAVVEAKDNAHQVADGLQQGIGYAEDLDVPFAYSSNGFGFREHDMITGAERNLAMDEFPTAKELWERYKTEKNITEDEEKVIEEPYHMLDINKKPRYYQRIAINKTVEAIAKGKDRLLLVMATGTGKTFTAFQIIYKLWKSGTKKKILYLADRNILIDQTMQNDFVNGKIKCRKSVKINVGFPTFLISVTITIEVIVNVNMENENKLRNMLKEMIRLNIKPNFAALGREYGCDYRTAKIKYYEEQNKEKGIEIVKKSRKYIIDDYK